jgi:predicted GNAT family N-acyltransferase
MQYNVTILDKEADTQRIREHLQWWTDQTKREKHMLKVTPESLERELLVAVLVFSDTNIVGAAAIVHARNKSNKEIYHDGKKTVELGSNIITATARNQGLGQLLIKTRLEVCAQRNWFPVSVTTNPIIQEIFRKMSASPMDKHPQLKKAGYTNQSFYI